MQIYTPAASLARVRVCDARTYYRSMYAHCRHLTQRPLLPRRCGRRLDLLRTGLPTFDRFFRQLGDEKQKPKSLPFSLPLVG